MFFFILPFSLLSPALQWHHREGNFFLEYDQYNWLFYVGWYLEMSSSLQYIQGFHLFFRISYYEDQETSLEVDVNGIHHVLAYYYYYQFKQVEVNYTKKYINSLYLFGTRENCHKNGKKLLLIQFIRQVIKWTVIITEEFHSCLLHINYSQTYFYQEWLLMLMEL